MPTNVSFPEIAGRVAGMGVPMIHLDDLAQIAEDLRKAGVDVCHEVLSGPRGLLEGLDVGEDFFPLWELNLPDNQEAFERYDFAAIKARRGPNWSVVPNAQGG
jgi:hypothetical protein